MSSSESSPAPSPSPTHSPAASLHGLPNLERLVTHFVAAKRSLNATSHVYRANELVTSSRTLIEEIAVLKSKNAFGCKGLEEQVETLDAIRDALVDEGGLVSEEFQATVAALDKAHQRLEKTLSSLKKTLVRARAEQTSNTRQGWTADESDASVPDDATNVEPPKTLYDFIDDATHEDLLQSLRNLIDSFHSAQADLDTDLETFNRTLRSINDNLSDNLHGSLSAPPNQPTIYDEPPPTISKLFESMESHATEMASLLGNLIDHHDKCVFALKHTEGGGEAARTALQQSEDLLRQPPPPGLEESLSGAPAADPISDEERLEMLTVVEGDATYVEDVAQELRDLAASLEDSYRQLTREVHAVRDRHATLRRVLAATREVRAAVPAHLAAARRFSETWAGIRAEMRGKTAEVAGLAVFYEQFLLGYGKLLREVERRRASEAQMRKVAEKARRELEKLWEADSAARREFMEDVSEYMPSDLGAWHGLEEDGPRWEVRPVREDEAEDAQARDANGGPVRLHDG